MPIWLLKTLHWLGLTKLSDVEVEWYADPKREETRGPIIERTSLERSSAVYAPLGPVSYTGIQWKSEATAAKVGE